VEHPLLAFVEIGVAILFIGGRASLAAGIVLREHNQPVSGA
jgi:hypothetical protein